jgi:hypothetical protein
VFKSIAILFLFLFSCTSFAQETPDQRCGHQATKVKQETCYLQLIRDRKEALTEYEEAIDGSYTIPPQVKAQVLNDYRSFMRNISSTCPDNACISGAMLEQIKDMYKETAKHTTAH